LVVRVDQPLLSRGLSKRIVSAERSRPTEVFPARLKPKSIMKFRIAAALGA